MMNLGEESFCNKLVKVRRTANDFGNLMKTDKNIRQKKATGNQRPSGFDSLYDVFHDTKNAKYKEKNFHFTYKLEGDTYVLTGVKCIDNDMSFGLFVDIKKGFNRSKPVDDRNIRGLPTVMLNRFMAMTPGTGLTVHFTCRICGTYFNA